jgi:hypothetical protein
MNRSSIAVLLAGLTLSFPAVAQGALPIIDNERVAVWDTTATLPPAAHDFVAVPLSKKGTAVFGHMGDIPGEAGVAHRRHRAEGSSGGADSE